jgi:hypothetical protein
MDSAIWNRNRSPKSSDAASSTMSCSCAASMRSLPAIDTSMYLFVREVPIRSANA